MKKQPTPAAAEKKRAAQQTVAAPKKRGRPPIYGQEHKDRICEEMAIGRTLPDILRDEGMPEMRWVWRALESDEAFRLSYARAREARTELWAEGLIEIADDGRNDTYLDENGNKRTDHDVVARSRLRVDTRKWLASKLLPKVYGDRVTTELTGEGGGPVQVATVKLDALRKAASRVRGG